MSSMIHIDCPHKNATHTWRECRHLFEDEEQDIETGWQFTGIGKEYNIICHECADNLENLESNLRTVCEECARDNHFYFVVGQPEVKKRKTPLGFNHRTIQIPGLVQESFLDIQPVESESASTWIAVTASRKLVKIDLNTQTYTTFGDVTNFTENIALRMSPDGKFVAIVNELGIDGIVIDLTTNQITMRLKRTKYFPEHTPFPVAFFLDNERSLIIHSIEGKGLNISDPRTGELLTNPDSAVYQNKQPLPERIPAFFHTSLVVSPDNQYVANDGWIWHPIGIVVTWNLHKWLNENCNESEFGTSHRKLCDRDHFWNGSLCWVSNSTLAVWGYGSDDLCMVPAARLFDVTTGRELRWFSGPSGKFEFDKYLFSFSETHGLSVWDVEIGEQLFYDLDFTPIRYNHRTKQFLTIAPNGTFTLSELSLNNDGKPHPDFRQSEVLE